MPGIVWVALFLGVVGVAFLIFEPGSSVLPQSRRSTSAQLASAMDMAPLVGAYRKHRKKVLARTMIEAYQGTFFADVAQYIYSGSGFEQALADAGQSAPAGQPWRDFVARAVRLASVERSMVVLLKEMLMEVGAVSAALDLSTLAYLNTKRAGATLAKAADRIASNADERAEAQAEEKAQQLPVKLMVPMVVLYIPVALLLNVGDVLWEFIQAIGGVFR